MPGWPSLANARGGKGSRCVCLCSLKATLGREWARDCQLKGVPCLPPIQVVSPKQNKGLERRCWEHVFQSQPALDWSCVIVGKSLNLSETHFPHLRKDCRAMVLEKPFESNPHPHTSIVTIIIITTLFLCNLSSNQKQKQALTPHHEQDLGSLETFWQYLFFVVKYMGSEIYHFNHF